MMLPVTIIDFARTGRKVGKTRAAGMDSILDGMKGCTVNTDLGPPSNSTSHDTRLNIP
jgi:hypothetical protein